MRPKIKHALSNRLKISVTRERFKDSPNYVKKVQVLKDTYADP